MSATTETVRGVVKDGVVELPLGAAPPDGTAVDVVVPRRTFVPADPSGPPVDAYGNPVIYTPEEAAELAGWNKIGDEAWVMIHEWEKEGDADATR